MKKRDADKEIYNDSYYFDEPKEYFKFIGSSIEEIKSEKHPQRIDKIIDIGCANGALLSYLSQLNPTTSLHGYEPEITLIELGRELAPDINFHKFGLYDIPDQDEDDKADIVIAAGVIGIFDNPEKFLAHLSRLCKQGGSILIFSPFNENDIDVILQYRPSLGTDWQTGHNLFSLKTMEMISGKFNLKLSVSSFKMPFAIEKTNDPMRSWTESFRGEEHFLFYGTNMFSTMKLLRIDK